MNIHQFHYIQTLAEVRHFETAAEKCHITQSTLSTMISKFEDEIGVKIFDRKKKPVEITAEGQILLEQLKKINKEIEQLSEISKEIKGEIKGDLTIAVIPTIAPSLLPLFITKFAKKFPELNIDIVEQPTAEIMKRLKSRDLDIGILSIPLNDPYIKELHCYDEPFVFFDTNSNHQKDVDANQLDVSNLCLLDEGHCMRAQILELCKMNQKRLNHTHNFKYNAGSIDSLMKFVKANNGSTLLPLLSTFDLAPNEKKHIQHFNDPQPFRSIGLAVHRHFVKNKILDLLKIEIQENIKPFIPQMQLTGSMLNPL
jgi:LysR family hydrogen peroxide-inducible transcriptional activator